MAPLWNLRAAALAVICGRLWPWRPTTGGCHDKKDIERDFVLRGLTDNDFLEIFEMPKKIMTLLYQLSLEEAISFFQNHATVVSKDSPAIFIIPTLTSPKTSLLARYS